MNKKRYIIFLVAVLSLCLMAGCGKKQKKEEHKTESKTEDIQELIEQKDSYTFGFSGMNMEDPYFDVLRQAMEIELKDYEIALEVKDASMDQEIQNQQINEFIEEEIDLLFLVPVDKQGVQPGIDALNEAGIPIINIDTKVEDIDSIRAFVGSDNKDIGFMCGEHLVEKMPEGGNVVIIEDLSSHAVNDRINGFEQVLSKENFQVVSRKETTCDIDGAYTAMMQAIEECIAKNVEIDAVMCGNDNMALGVEKALEEVYGKITVEDTDVELEEDITEDTTKNDKRIFVYGVNGSPDVKEVLASKESYIVATVAQSPINMGMQAVEIAVDLIKNRDYDKEVTTPSFLINNGNIVLYGTNGWQ